MKLEATDAKCYEFFEIYNAFHMIYSLRLSTWASQDLTKSERNFQKTATKCKPSLYILFFMFWCIKSITSSILPGVNDIKLRKKE